MWLTEAVQAEQLAAGVAAGDHARAHVTPREVLQLLVDVQVPDAALEAGAVQQLGGPAGGRGDPLVRHACGDGVENGWGRGWVA